MEVDEWFENDKMITFEIINFGFLLFRKGENDSSTPKAKLNHSN